MSRLNWNPFETVRWVPVKGFAVKFQSNKKAMKHYKKKYTYFNLIAWGMAGWINAIYLKK